MKRTKASEGLTLIELLVVIVIIAILAAILFPVFAKAREKARQAACMSNTKQLAQAILAYAQDYDEVLPAVAQAGTAPGATSRWWSQPDGYLYPYYKSNDLTRCLSCTAKSYTTSGSNKYWGGNYGLNLYLCGMPGFSSVCGGMLAKVPDTTKIILLADSSTKNTTTGAPNGPQIYIQTAANRASGSTTVWADIDYRHNGGANIAFCDGHVKWHTPESLYAAGSWSTLYGYTSILPYQNKW